MKANDWNHLARITLANLPKGKINLTADEILSAMVEAVAKESVMCQQLLTDPAKMEAFSKVVGPMAWDKVH